MNKNVRLSASLAQRSSVLSRTNREFTALRKIVANPPLFNGVTKTYTARNEDELGEPPQTSRVRYRVSDVLDQVRDLASQQLNVEATVDAANCVAKGTVYVGDEEVLKDVPVTTLLTLEKELTQLSAFLSSLPVLDESYEWKMDESASLYKTEAIVRNSTRKVQKPLVLAPATEKHPAQTQLITTDEVVGLWETVNASGAIRLQDRNRMVKRCNQLVDAIKVAREEANSTQHEPVDVATPLMEVIFGNRK